MPYRLRVQELAQEHGLDQSKLARKAELAYKTVRTLWHNPHSDVQLSTLSRIASVLGVSINDLIEDIPSNAHQGEKPDQEHC